jgi:hypothetical protein
MKNFCCLAQTKCCEENCPTKFFEIGCLYLFLLSSFFERIRLKRVSLAMTLLCFSANVAPAQANNAKWQFLIEPYLMIPNMRGEAAVRRLPPTEVDADAGSIFDRLKFGAMLYLEASNSEKDWAFSSDLIYMDLEQDIKPRPLINGGDVSAKQLAWELGILKRIATWLEIGAGFRLINLEAVLRLQTFNGNESAAQAEVWFDPIAIVRSQRVVREKWLLQLRGDLGGFGVGSDLTWQVQANVGYKISKLFQASVGYRVIAIDYNKGDGPDRFVYDINTFGPVVRLGFSLN